MTQKEWITLCVLAGSLAMILWSFYVTRQRASTLARLEDDAAPSRRPVDTYPPRFRWAGPLLAVLAFGGAMLLGSWPLPYAFASAALAGVLGLLAEELVATSRIARIEQQLVDMIDLIVSSLRAGSSLQAALDAAREQSRAPIRGELDLIIGRIRMGEDPRGVLRNLGLRVPLESFRLFSHAMLVHWDSGGSLAGTLLLIGRSIRDRIEVSRRVQAQAVESQISVIAIMGVSHGTGLLMYFSNPAALQEFARSFAGTWIIVFAVLLQALGIYWIWRLSQVRF